MLNKRVKINNLTLLSPRPLVKTDELVGHPTSSSVFRLVSKQS